jgi:SAM-dependent methyltransferase/uncharacterized protein YbaR (Trm112 family)
MQAFVLNDVYCPAWRDDAPCHGRLALDQEQVSAAHAPTDADEIVEGLLRCAQCDAAYPVLCGLPILVAQPWLYLRNNYGTVLSLAAEAGFPVSQAMIALLQEHKADVGPTTGGDKYSDRSMMGTYLSAHYDNVWETLPDKHPLRAIVRDHQPRDFYTAALESLAPHLDATQRALDVGCSVGRGVYELARRCGLTYGVEPAYGPAFFARRVLRRFPTPLESYWLKWDGDVRQRRPLSDWRRDDVEILVASGDNLPFPANTFDALCSWNVIDRVPHPAKLLAEQERVLRPGGVFSTTDPYSWTTSYTPRKRWIGGQDGVRSADALRQRLGQTFDVLEESAYIPWFFWNYERSFQLYFSHGLVARKRPASEEGRHER